MIIVTVLVSFLEIILLLNIGPLDSDNPKADHTKNDAGEQFIVTAMPLEPFNYQPEIRISAKTIANREIKILAETSGIIENRLVSKGDQVKTDDLLVQIQKEDRFLHQASIIAQIEEAKARLLNAAKSTNKSTQQQLNQLNAQNDIQQMSLRLAALEIDIERTQIRAPFSGILIDHFVEEGQFIESGEPLFDLIELYPIRLLGYLSQQQALGVTKNHPVDIQLSTGEQLRGRVDAITHHYDKKTHLTLVEVVVDDLSDNYNLSVKAGLSAQIKIYKETITTFKVPLSALILRHSSDLQKPDRLSVMLLNHHQHVKTMPIKLLGASENEAFIQFDHPTISPKTASDSNLSNDLRYVIIQGMGYVEDQQKVQASIVNPSYPTFSFDDKNTKASNNDGD
ncbi:MAG: efflux RND transporter periplasmic adaptor subunit [Pseudomonadota bacterium]